MTDTPASAIRRRPVRLSDPRRRPHLIDIAPDEAERAAIAAEIGIDALPAFTVAGALEPLGSQDWTLTADLVARVVQPCVVTMEPVETALRERVTRRYIAALGDEPAPVGEVEMPDDEAEPLPATLDLTAVAIEALALALPDWPRAPGAMLDVTVEEEAGDERPHPFAGLRDALAGRGTGGTGGDDQGHA